MRAISSEASSSCCVVIAPIAILLPLRVMPLRSPMPCRSTRCSGVASRSFIIGTRLCPPASGRASSPNVESNFTASATDAGR